MPITTAAITSRRARRARRKETTTRQQLYSPCSSEATAPRSPATAAYSGYTKRPTDNQPTSSQSILVNRTPPDGIEETAKKLRKIVVTFEGEVNMEEGVAQQTLAMTHSQQRTGGSRTISPSSSNECSPTTTRTPALPGGSSEDSPQGIERSFKRRRSFNSRRRDVDEIVKKHPHKVPIIIERAKNEKSLGLLDKSKFLVPEELTMSQLTTIIRRRLHLTDTQSFYLIVNRRTMVSASMTLAEVYRSDKDTDGFLYITYASQEMFG